MQLLVVLAYVGDDPLELILVELHLVIEGQRVAQLRHLVLLFLVDLLDELDVFAQRLIIVLDGDAAIEFVVELVEQIHQIRPGLVAVQLVLLDVLFYLSFDF